MTALGVSANHRSVNVIWDGVWAAAQHSKISSSDEAHPPAHVHVICDGKEKLRGGTSLWAHDSLKSNAVDTGGLFPMKKLFSF